MKNQIGNGNPDKGPEEKREFIRETVEAHRKNRAQIRLVRFAILVCSAILFGVIACLSFVLTKPWIEERFGVNQPAQVPVVIPRDEQETEAPAETEAETEEAPIDPAALEEEMKNMVSARLDQYLETLEVQVEPEYVDEYQLTKEVQALLAPSMVVVTSRSAGEDVFRNTFTRSEQTFGLISLKTENELLILTEDTLIGDEGVMVTIFGETVDAAIRGTDSSLGMAVISVAKEALHPELWDAAVPAALGNSYVIGQGDYVAALGTPLDSLNSVLSGSVAYVKPLQQSSDMNFRLIQTDIACDKEASGILVNGSGAVMGWISQRYNSEGMAGVLAAISISELKGSIENLSNGRENASMGIRYLPIEPAVSEAQEIPAGLYITGCAKDGAASEAGIQNGDILVRAEDQEIVREKDFRTWMESKIPGDTVKVTVMRVGRGGYTEQEYELTLTAR